jgi:hypothetical protein
MSPDFRPGWVGVDMAVSSLIMCPNCGFTTSFDKFNHPEGLDKAKVKAALSALKSPLLFQKLDRAVMVERNWSNDPLVIAHLTLAAKWFADDTGEPAVIKKRLEDAIGAHKAALESGKFEGPQEKGMITYLIGELYRQAGDQKQAVDWFKKAEKLVDPNAAYLVQQQMFLAQYGDKQPKDMLATAVSGTDGQKLAAIRFLRESQDPAVLTFLKEFCLNGPEALREPAIYELLGQEPKPYHLPIFLEGLRSTHFRTVQGCALGVENLKAVEAAPVIVDVLKNSVKYSGSHPKELVVEYMVLALNDVAFNALQPTGGMGIFPVLGWRIGQCWRATRAPAGCHTAPAVFLRVNRLPVILPLALCDTRTDSISTRPNFFQPTLWEESQYSEHRLYAALAAVATEKQLDFLSTQLDQKADSDDIFKALLNTRSPKAVPFILEMLQSDKMRGLFSDQETLEKAAAMGPALTDKLPDISSASFRDNLAAFKIRILELQKPGASDEQLLSAMQKGGDVGTFAAFALARKGNEAAKPFLLSHLDDFRWTNEEGIALLLPLLKSSDYAELNQLMFEDRARAEDRLKYVIADTTRRANDPNEEPAVRDKAKRDLKRLKWDEPFFMNEWIPLLGATGNAQGRDLDLECLKSPDPSLRAQAARALGKIYTDAVGAILSVRLGKEEPVVTEAIIEAIGVAKDKSKVDALLSLVEEPTLVSTKLIWIDVMMKLAPEKALPIIKAWAGSTNSDLAQACKKAIGTTSSNAAR